jgi:DNA-binding beta-propeller fold protein YncE
VINHNLKYSIFLSLLLLLGFSCTKDQSPIAFGSYPSEVGTIFAAKCATSGCHNDASFKAAGNLNLSTWEKLFQGAPTGSVVIAGRADLSSLCYFINYETSGTKLDASLPSIKPYMPLNSEGLSVNEYNAIKKWIADGALNDKGKRFFEAQSIAQKYYITNQGCDEVCVVDAKTNLPINYVHVGISASPELPHMVRVSPDGNHWYVCFIGNQQVTTNTPSNIFQKFDAKTDQLLATCNLTNTNGSALSESTSWNTFAISPDSKKACVTDLSSGVVVIVDLITMKTIGKFKGQDKLHGSAFSKSGDTLYVTHQFSDVIEKINLKDTTERELVIIGPPNAQPHEIIFSPDYKYYFLTCQGTNSVRVYRTADDGFVKSIPTAVFPQEMAISIAQNQLFVTCTNDNTKTINNTKGVVEVIDIASLSIIKTLNDFAYEPHGIAVDDNNQQLIVANRNTSSLGPAPHHTTNCGGRNGYLTIFELNAFQKKRKRIELLPDPYSVAVKP